jgi:hypothetical protein
MKIMELANSQRRYEISVWKDDHRSPVLRRPWEILASSRDSSSAAYQSPEYFDYLQDIDRTNRLEVLTVKDETTDTIVGVVPISIWVYRLHFAFMARTLISPALRSIGILGGEPMIPEDPAAFDEMFITFAKCYPESQVIYMDPVPSTSHLWRHLQTSPAIRRLYYILVVGGFREWHSVPIPRSADEYYKKLPRKRRYNLLRQERLLQSHCGEPLHLSTICKEEDLPDLFEAIKKLPTENKYNFVFRKEEYVYLARYGLLRCYVLKAGPNVIGLLLGMKAGKIFKIDRFVHDPSLKQYSPGTTLWQLALRDLIGSGEFTNADFGYGLPAYRHRSTNIIEQKGRILLFRRSIANLCLILAYSCFSAVVNFVKNKFRRGSRVSKPEETG